VTTVSLVDATGAPAVDAIVVGTVSGPDGLALAPGAQALDAALGGRLLDALKTLGATGRAEELHRLATFGLAEPPLVVAVGLGRAQLDAPIGAADLEVVRRAVGGALRSLQGTGRVRVAIGAAPDPALVGAIAEGALLGDYRFTEYKSGPGAKPLQRLTISAPGGAGGAARASRAALRSSQIVVEAVVRTRDLINLAPNELYPATLAQRMTEFGEAAGLSVEVLDERALRRGGYGGILGVGAGSTRPPRLVRLAYRPRRAVAKVALIGKGITFDSGGLNIKSAMMEWMKSDMSGAAAVAAATAAAARLGLPVEVVATIPIAENLPSGSAYRPSDVLTIRGGRTVEVLNTDAEGRIVLADAIVRAAEDEPDFLIETSTLTGAQMVSLGTRVVAAMGEDALRDRVVAAGASAGESLWPMPLPPELRRGLDSTVADLANVSGERWGGMLVGGLFLADFIPDGLPWVHLDIAGPAFNNGGPYGYTPKGGTGVIVRTILATLADIARG
jgi:leucyl aminopeptidase